MPSAVKSELFVAFTFSFFTSSLTHEHLESGFLFWVFFFHCLVWFYFILFETGFLCVTQADLELTL